MEKIKIYAFSDEAGPAIDDQIEALHRNGLSGMEIRNIDGVNVSDISLEEARLVKEKLSARGLEVFSIGSPIGKIGINEDFQVHLEKFKHTLELAKILDAQNMRIFSFYLPSDQSESVFQDTVFERLNRFLEVAEGYGVLLCHENEKGIFGSTPERCLMIHCHLPKIKAVFDPANFVQCGIDSLAAWETLKDHVRYLHIKDALADGFNVPAGEGCGNVEKIVKSYLSLGGRDFTIEPHLAAFCGFSDLEQGEEFKTHLKFSDNNQAFDSACLAFKNLLKR